MTILKKKIVTASLIGLLTVSLGVAASNKTSILTLADADPCTHNGNHYTILYPTSSSCGCKEYWVCCDCHEHYLEQPSTGNWVDAGIASPITDPSDDRYIAQVTDPTNPYVDNQGLTISDDGTEVVKYSPISGVTDIVIPEGIVDIGTVFNAGPGGTYKNSAITSITLPSTVESLDANAFRDCMLLKHINLGGVKSISTIVNTKNDKGVVKIDGECQSPFFSCNSLEYVIIPSTVDTIGAFAFGTGQEKNTGLKLFCEVSTPNAGWVTNYMGITGADWNSLSKKNKSATYPKYATYMLGQWHYDSDGTPVVG